VALGLGATWVPLLGSAAADETLHVSDLRWTGLKPSFPPFRARLAGAPSREVEVRVATRSDPVRYRPFLAFYELAVSLGSKLVPRTRLASLPLPEILGALRRDPAGLALLRDDVAVQNDGTVSALVIDPIPGGREVEVASSAEIRQWRALAEGRQPVPPERISGVSGYVEALVLDYLAANAGRGVVTIDADAPGATVHLLENGAAFAERPDVAAFDALLAQLRRVGRFSTRLITKLRALDRAAAEATLHGGPFARWLVSTRPLLEMLERRGAILSLVEARAAEVGVHSVLGFP